MLFGKLLLILEHLIYEGHELNNLLTNLLTYLFIFDLFTHLFIYLFTHSNLFIILFIF
jgi:hypothetical protein